MVSKEILGAQIATLHNLSFYIWLVKEARKNILTQTFSEWKNIMVKQISQRI
jgi:queuine tRNA-ribosyltransferase